jgi:hypothetical protein
MAFRAMAWLPESGRAVSSRPYELPSVGRDPEAGKASGW